MSTAIAEFITSTQWSQKWRAVDCVPLRRAWVPSMASTAARVRKVIDELGYVPSSRAVGLARGRTRVVGMLVPSLTWPWIGEVLQGAVDVLETERYGLLLFTCNRGEESMRQFGAQVSAKSFDGLLAGIEKKMASLAAR